MQVSVDLTPDGASFMIRFRYDPAVVSIAQMIPGRRFHRGLLAWIAPFTKELAAELPGRFIGHELRMSPAISHKVSELTDLEQSVLTLKEDLTHATVPSDMEFPKDYPAKLHQKKALEFFAQRKHFGFFKEQGTGKTYVILTGLNWLKAKPALVVCPSSVMFVWEDQAKQFYPNLKVKILMGTIAKRKKQLQEAYLTGTDIVVMNYEATWRMEDELAAIPWKMITLDESSRIKNRTTRQTRSLLRLAPKIPYRYILSGTPNPNTPLELFSQFLFLDPAIMGPHFYAFRDRYAIMGGYQGGQVVGWKNTAELMGKVKAHSFRVLKKDCLDLPEKVYTTQRLALSDEQQKAYDSLSKTLVAELSEDKKVTASVVIAKLVKLREITAGFVMSDDKNLHYFKESVKLKALQELIEFIPKEQKLVIWCTFRAELEAIAKILPAESFVTIHGGVEISKRGDIVRSFQEDPKIRFFLGQQEAGGLGITLTAANHCVFMTNDYSPEVRLQAEDRLHRIGQRNVVNYYDFVCKGTIDVAVIAALRRKQKVSEMIMGDNLAAVVQGNES